MTDQLTALNGGPTLHQWLEQHPTDDAWPDTASSPVDLEPQWCARADSVPVVPGGWRREAYFAVPRPASSLQFPRPAVGDPPGADCSLVLLVLARGGLDSIATDRRAGAIHDQLARTGQTVGMARVPLRAAEAWHEAFYTRRDSLMQLTATRSDTAGPEVVVAGWLPAGVRSEDGWREDVVGDTAEWERYWTREAAVAARESGAGQAASAALLALLDESLAWKQRRRASDGRAIPPLQPERLRRTLAEWLRGLDGLPSDQRAAGLFAADIAVAVAVEPFQLDPGGDVIQTGLAAGGPGGLTPAAESGSAHLLLLEARRADSLGALGERTTFRLAQLGLPRAGSCHPDQTTAPEVIVVAESLLAERPTGPRAAELHLILAAAHRDLSLRPAPPAVIDPFEDRESNRLRELAAALTHFRAAMELEPSSPLLRPFWTEAYRLASGLRARRIAYLCQAPGATASP